MVLGLTTHFAYNLTSLPGIVVSINKSVKVSVENQPAKVSPTLLETAKADKAAPKVC